MSIKGVKYIKFTYNKIMIVVYYIIIMCIYFNNNVIHLMHGLPVEKVYRQSGQYHFPSGTLSEVKSTQQ